MVKNTRPQTIKEILSNHEGPLVQLYSHTADISTLQTKLRTYLPASLREHVSVANYDKKTLSLYADNAAWATRLRFKIPDILQIARNKCMLSNIQTVRISVIPAERKAVIHKRTAQLTDKTAQLLRNAGESMSDPELRQVFLQLSRNRSD